MSLLASRSVITTSVFARSFLAFSSRSLLATSRRISGVPVPGPAAICAQVFGFAAVILRMASLISLTSFSMLLMRLSYVFGSGVRFHSELFSRSSLAAMLIASCRVARMSALVVLFEPDVRIAASLSLMAQRAWTMLAGFSAFLWLPLARVSLASSSVSVKSLSTVALCAGLLGARGGGG